jgi:DNA topoisomerase IB
MIRRSITKILKQTKMDRNFAAAVLVDLIACTAIRSGSEAYARGSTLLKKHVQIMGDKISLWERVRFVACNAKPAHHALSRHL